MNKKELREILEKHKKWLNNEEGGKRADLRYADLREADLRAADLRAADLREADLSYADLSNADFSNADLRYANLDYSVLPLWCGSVKTHFDDKQIIQFIYHATKAGLYSKNVSTEIKEELKKLAPLANKFHRVEECGKISTENNQAQRTGCSMCGFGIHMEQRPHRFDRLYEDNPKEWKYWMYNCCTDKDTGEKYGWGRVLTYIGVPWEIDEHGHEIGLDGQLSLI